MPGTAVQPDSAGLTRPGPGPGRPGLSASPAVTGPAGISPPRWRAPKEAADPVPGPCRGWGPAAGGKRARYAAADVGGEQGAARHRSAGSNLGPHPGPLLDEGEAGAVVGVAGHDVAGRWGWTGHAGEADVIRHQARRRLDAPSAAAPPFGQRQRSGAGQVEPERGADGADRAGDAGEGDVEAATGVEGGGLQLPSSAVPPLR